MKILGEKSLSSKVITGLKALFAIISVIDIAILSVIVKIINHIVRQENLSNNLLDLSVFTMIIITGIIALFIIYQFIRIFRNLKNNEIFCTDNSKSLKSISKSCFLIGIFYLIITILMAFIISKYAEAFIYYVLAFSITFTIIFLVSGIGIKILNEIYIKAIEYKEENDYTI